jgi:hypothetical protein
MRNSGHQPGTSVPQYPTVVTIAGIIWIVNACVIALILVVLLLFLFGFFGGPVQAVFPGSMCSFLFGLFTWAFMGVGEQSVRGTARPALLNGIASIFFGIFLLSPGILGLLNRGSAIFEGDAGVLITLSVGLFGGGALIAAGILWLVGLSQYRAWLRARRV